MTQKPWFLLVCALIVLSFVVGCGTSSPATPTKAAATVAPAVVTVIITATLPPPTATAPVPTITPIPTLAITTTVPVTTSVKPTNTPGAPRPTATRRPATATPVPAVVPPSPVPLKYAAPRLIGPVNDPGLGRRDERHNPADTLIFQWMATGPLGENECYSVRVDMNPGQGDAFLTCDSSVTQLTPGSIAQFTLYRPGQAGPNYAGLLPPEVGDTAVSWSVQVVKDLGKGTGPSAPDGVRHNVAPLSPKSSTFQFPLKGQ
ncbi:MAG TPA: hypothetical protein VF932_13995 [Anaerolineae bacterium]